MKNGLIVNKTHQTHPTHDYTYCLLWFSFIFSEEKFIHKACIDSIVFGSFLLKKKQYFYNYVCFDSKLTEKICIVLSIGFSLLTYIRFYSSKNKFRKEKNIKNSSIT